MNKRSMKVFVSTKMINQRIQNYIDNHAFCSEYLFKDWEGFLDLLYAEGYRISSILWWDHCLKSQHHESVGSAGYNYPENNDFYVCRNPVVQRMFGNKYA